MLQRARSRAALAVLCVFLGLIVVLAGIGVAARGPDRRSGVEVLRRDVPGIVDDANAELADLQDLARRQRDRRRGRRRRARRRSRRSAIALTEGSGELVVVHARGGHHAHRGVDRADPDHRALGLHAALRRAHRRRASARSSRAATARPRTTTRPASSGPSSATCAGSCCSRVIMGTSAGVAAVGPRLARHLPGRQDVRARVRRVLRLRGADPVRRPGDRRRAADRSSRCSAASRSTRCGCDHVHRAAADRGPHRRAEGVRPGAADQPACS